MENEIELRPVDENFGTGMFVSWKDRETKTVLISNWGVYDKKTEDGTQLAFRCNVLNLDGIKFNLGTKVIDTTSINFHKAIAPFLRTKEETLYLEITRIGEKKKTAYNIKSLEVKK